MSSKQKRKERKGIQGFPAGFPQTSASLVDLVLIFRAALFLGNENIMRCSFSGRATKTWHVALLQQISGQVDRASATEAVDSSSIPGQVKPKTIKIGIHNFPA